MTRNSIWWSVIVGFSPIVYAQISPASIIRFALFFLLAAVLVAQTSGCAHEPKSVPRNITASVQSLGILAVGQEPEMSVTAPTRGRVAVGGAGDAFSMVPSCSGPCALIMLPVAVLFAGGGAIVGALEAESKENITAARDAIEKAVKEMTGAVYLAQRVQKRFESKVRAPTILLYASEMPQRDESLDYQKLADFAVDAVLEIRSAFVHVKSGFSAHPSVVIEVVVSTRLVRVPDGTVILARTFDHDNICDEYPKCYIGAGDPSLAFFEIAKDDAALLRKFLDQAMTKLSQDILSFYKPAVMYHRQYKPY